MSGTAVYRGRDPESYKADMLVVGVGTQRMSVGPAGSGSDDLVIHALRARVGRWTSTNAIFRLGVMSTNASGHPDQVLAHTVEATTSVPFTGSNEGETRTFQLETPIVVSSGALLAFVATARSGILAVGMEVVSSPAIYQRDIAAGSTVPLNSYTSVPASGRMAIQAIGELNVAPTAPSNLAPTGGTNVTGINPVLSAAFNDANNVLNGGQNWDYPLRANYQIRYDGGATVQDVTYYTQQGEQSSRAITTTVSNLPAYNQNYEWRLRLQDRRSVWGAWSGWQKFTTRHVNSPPNQPGVIANNSGNASRQPSMSATYSDPDEVLPNGQAYDYLASYYRELWWGGVLRWHGTFTATQAERDAKKSTRAIGVGGATADVLIPYDTQYQLHEWHIDRSGAWSPSRTYTGSVPSAASVDQPYLPNSFVFDPSAPGNIKAVYRNNSGANATNFNVRVVNASMSVVMSTSPSIAKSVSPNNEVTITWAETAFAALQQGTDLGLQLQVLDSNGNWSGWSPVYWFRVNMAPNTPVFATPNNGAVASDLPMISFTASDPDSQTPLVAVSVEIKNNATNALLGTFNPTWNPSTNRFELAKSVYQGSVPNYGTYRAEVRAYDGYLYSAWATPVTFQYAAVPSVSITSPLGPTISTSEPTIAWSATGQTGWRVQLFDGSRIVYDTGQQGGSNANHTLQGVFWQGGEVWNKDEIFSVVVQVQDSTSLWGTSSPVTLKLQYAAVTTVAITASGQQLEGIPGTHYIFASWEQSAYPQSQFRNYVVEIAEIDQPSAADLRTPKKVIRRTGSIGDNILRYYEAKSGQWYRVFVTQVVRIGNDIISSEPTFTDVMVQWDGEIIHSNLDPAGSYVWLRWGAPDSGSPMPSVSQSWGRQDIFTKDKASPLAYMESKRVVSVSGEYSFLSIEGGPSAIDQMSRLYEIADWQSRHLSPNGKPNGICWRSGRGGSRGVLFVTIESIEAQRRQSQLAEGVNIEFEEYRRSSGA